MTIIEVSVGFFIVVLVVAALHITNNNRSNWF